MKTKGLTDSDVHNALENYVKYWMPQYSELQEKPEDITHAREWDRIGMTIVANKMKKILQKERGYVEEVEEVLEEEYIEELRPDDLPEGVEYEQIERDEL